MSGLLARLVERRNTTEVIRLDDPNAFPLFRGDRTLSGRSVGQGDALKVSAVFACVRVLADAISALPVGVFRDLEAGGGKAAAPNHPLDPILRRRANEDMTPVELLDVTMVHLTLRGNAYWMVVRDQRDRVVEIIPLNPDAISIRRNDDGKLEYLYQGARGEPRTLLAGRSIVHLRGLSGDGIIGYSVIRQARESMGLALALEEFGTRRFSNDSRPSGVLTRPGELSKEAKHRLREDWEQAYGGISNSFRTAILDEDMKYTPISMTADDAQFLESRQFQITDIARWFRVPPHKIADLTKATFSNIEHQSLEFETDSVRPWVERIEARIDMDLLEPPFFTKFNTNALLRGDIKSRFESYRIGRDMGVYSANDVRELEDQNPIEGGDIYVMPLNMVNVQDVIEGATRIRGKTASLVALTNAGFDPNQAADVVGLPRIAKPNDAVTARAPQLEGNND